MLFLVNLSAVELEFLKSEANSDGNPAKRLLFWISKLDDLWGTKCTGKGKGEQPVNQDKLNWVLQTTAALS